MGIKLLMHLKMVLFCMNIKKKTDNAAHYYVLEDVKDLKIASMSGKINLSLCEDFFGLSSPADYAKMLINTSPDENKKTVAETKDRISDLKDRIKEMSKKEKNIYKNADETLKIIEEILADNKKPQKSFQLASKVDKGKPEPKLEKSIAERVKVKNGKIAEIKKKKKSKTI